MSRPRTKRELKPPPGPPSPPRKIRRREPEGDVGVKAVNPPAVGGGGGGGNQRGDGSKVK